jgi:hypothetical protein
VRIGSLCPARALSGKAPADRPTITLPSPQSTALPHRHAESFRLVHFGGERERVEHCVGQISPWYALFNAAPVTQARTNAQGRTNQASHRPRLSPPGRDPDSGRRSCRAADGHAQVLRHALDAIQDAIRFAPRSSPITSGFALQIRRTLMRSWPNSADGGSRSSLPRIGSYSSEPLDVRSYAQSG